MTHAVPGTVYLIGAGPGDPGLITVKGLALLRSAEVILYDRLIPHALLDEVRPDAERIDVGKVSERPKQAISQEGINALIIEKAQAGKSVVRLKGGDPFVFGRGGEEALACREAGIPCLIVPGVSSAVAVPAYAGVPVTQRGMVTAFTVFAGHEDPAKEVSGIDFPALVGAARMGTLVLLMGLLNLEAILSRLIAAGLEAETPALCIEQGTTPDQRVVGGTVATLAEAVGVAGFKPPAITVIGAVVGLREALAWFGKDEQ
ncbi:MAG TPA: uroporphyrinogen-III C-methyltransferase [Aggregatilineales bacterium]|nr:uroporphyrinogen-III C-methyltransferase [Anaerolineales bacterium]HRE49515.1 uroporphyrinogen-III C-methyltransferase [Aggregatilineales bacterium]